MSKILRYYAICVLATVVLLSLTTAYADTISVNFVGGRSPEVGPLLNPEDLAGLVDPLDTSNPAYAETYVNNWNNVMGTSGNSIDLFLNTGVLGNTTLDFNSPNGTWSISTPELTGNDKMMSGYLDNFGDSGPTTVTLNNLTVDPSRGSYDVYVYFDGDNEFVWRLATFTIGSSIFTGEDSEYTDWKKQNGQNPYGYFQLPYFQTGNPGNELFERPPPGNTPNNGEGNYFVFTGLTASSFNLEVMVGGAGSAVTRAPLNGLQVVGVVAPVPEPATMLLLGSGLAGLAAFRRRFRK